MIKLKTLSNYLITFNLIIYIFLWLPAYFNDDYRLIVWTSCFLLFLSSIIIYVLLRRLESASKKT